MKEKFLNSFESRVYAAISTTRDSKLLQSDVSRFFFRRFIDVSQPRRIVWRAPFAANDLKESFLKLFGDMAAFAVADRDAVNRTNWCDLGSGSGKEKLVRQI